MLLMMMCHGVTQPLNGALVIIVTAWRCSWGAPDTIALYRIRRLMIQNSKIAPETTPCRLNLIQTKRDHHQHLQNHPGWFLVRMVPYLPRLSLLPYFPFTPLSLRADEHHYMALHYNKLHHITLKLLTLKCQQQSKVNNFRRMSELLCIFLHFCVNVMNNSTM